MRKIISLILTLSVLLSLAAVPVTVSAETTLLETAELYAAKLEEYVAYNSSKSLSTDQYKFTLAYIDEDNIPELIISKYGAHYGGNIDCYFVSGGELLSGSIPTIYGCVNFAPKENLFYYGNFSPNIESVIFQRWTGSSFDNFLVYKTTYKEGADIIEKTTINDESVSEDYYNQQLESMMTDYAWLTFDHSNAFVINSTNINAMKQNPKNFILGDVGITVLLNGSEMAFDVEPYIENGVTMVPMRAIFEALGADVGYDSETRTITAVKGDKTIILTVDSTSAYINGKEYTLQNPAVIIDGSTMVPLRFVSENLDADVVWNSDTKTISITSN
ncbi:MAG: copper amine oxidase N-terminal domain-containing protein [Clostridiales bacterium]|nr:copper amine oxidase N-terminal domain-containing protein [Clostridiales bacterium]